jgi:tetratricopeptide (TPR) repeat protein
VADWVEQWRVSGILVAGASVAILLLLAFATHRQLNYWSSDVALWSHTVEVTKDNSGAENVLGEALQKEGRADDAMLHFRSAAAMDPLLPYPYYHIGVYEQQHGNPQGAIERFRKVIDLTQSDRGVLAVLRADTLVRMSNAYEAVGDEADAAKCLNLAAQERRKQQTFAASGSP